MRKTHLDHIGIYVFGVIAIVLIAVILLFAQGSGYNSFQTTTFSSAIVGATIPQQGLIKYHQLIWTVTGSPSGCTVSLDTSVDGNSWSVGGAIVGQTCTLNGSSAITGVTTANFLRVNISALSGGTLPTVVVVYEGWAYNPAPMLYYSGTTGSIGGSALLAGACSTGTASVTGATAGMPVTVSPADGTNIPSLGLAISGIVTSSGTVTVNVCALLSVTPTAKTYSVRVLP